MRLNQMYQNVLSMDFASLELKVMADSERRDAFIKEVLLKIDVAPKSRVSAPKLSNEEKAVLKALGLSMKDLKTLREAVQ